ncbi:hypothetical protein JR316_0011040 [Psilocybe cubensis]|uniref:Uncharacterized protein n=1 Tax=Psilocybe cubensis TaxID=181762 RepID=A0ACB8GQ06_PSICU|nr:hypothetical protein JR316_0011040 [Psilocybe cubensis]KAH9477124.1 hypothetical protein JR316_0011040 [Psilocybe cubensis]
MSQYEFDAKFPASATPPRRITPETYVGNPFMMNAALDKLDHAFSEVISILEQESSSQDLETGDNVLLNRFKSWRDELEMIRLGEEDLSFPQRLASPPAQNEGGLFAD